MKRSCWLLLMCFSIAISAADNTSLKEYRQLTLADLPNSLHKATPESFEKLQLSSLKIQQTKKEGNPADKYVNTGLMLDVALLDPGYILLRTPGPYVTYPMTRFGSMSINRDGMLVIQHLYVQSMSSYGNIYLPSPILPPVATTAVGAQLNLSTVQEYEIHNSVYDSRGNYHIIGFHFIPLSNTAVSVVGTDEYENVFVVGSLYFNLDGTLAEQRGLTKITLYSARDDFEPIIFDMDFRGTTAYSSVGSSTYLLTANGFSAGGLVGILIGTDGSLHANYSNGVAVMFDQIAVGIESSSDLTPYMPLYPMSIWVAKSHPEYPRQHYTGIGFLSGYLEKDAFRIPDA